MARSFRQTALEAYGRTTLAVALLAGSALAACSSAAAVRPAGELPPYAGEHARLFDDSLSLRLARPVISPDGERLLGIRAAEADLVVVGRLRTINERTHGNRTRFLLVFTSEKSLAGLTPPETVIVEIGPENPSHGMIRAHRLKLMGISAVLFLKWFQHDDEPKLHARVEPDDPAIHDAVIAARF